MLRECKRCGNKVTPTYHRVNCNNYDELWSCPDCTPGGETLTGPDENTRTGIYEEHLEDIKKGKAVPTIGREARVSQNKDEAD